MGNTLSENKQIEEMAKLICTYPQCIHYNIIGGCKISECQTVDIAVNLYANGYRKASDVVEEIFAEIDRMLENDENDFDVCCDESKNEIDNAVLLALENYVHGIRKMIAELKKKYTEGEG